MGMGYGRRKNIYSEALVQVSDLHRLMGLKGCYV